MVEAARGARRVPARSQERRPLAAARNVEAVDFLPRLIDDFGEELTADPIVVQRHLQAIQTLGRTSQILAHLGAVLKAPDSLAVA